jgi:NitT/TauT family transport system permease protein
MKDYTCKSSKYVTASIIGLIVFWAIVSKIVNNEVIIPSIKSTTLSLITIIKDKSFIAIMCATLLRSLISFLISFLLAAFFGVIGSISKTVYNFMIPILAFLKAVPTMAVIMLALIWLSNDSAPILIGFIIVFPILYESVLAGVLNVNPKIVDMARLYKVKKWTVIKDIYIPNILMNVNRVMSSALGLNLKVVIAGEVLGQPKYSIGSSLQLEKMYLNTSGVFAWIIIIVISVVILEKLIKLLNIKMYNWSDNI